jgi:hypothetical protein
MCVCVCVCVTSVQQLKQTNKWVADFVVGKWFWEVWQKSDSRKSDWDFMEMRMGGEGGPADTILQTDFPPAHKILVRIPARESTYM